MHRLRHRQGGFTLTEMMVVVAIIALIVGVSIPNLGARRACGAPGRGGTVQQSLAVARIFAIKNSRQVALQLLPSNEFVADYEIFAWVDTNAEWSPRWRGGTRSAAGLSELRS